MCMTTPRNSKVHGISSGARAPLVQVSTIISVLCSLIGYSTVSVWKKLEFVTFLSVEN